MKKPEIIKIKYTDLFETLKGLGVDFTIKSVAYYDTFIKLYCECKTCGEDHERKLFFVNESETEPEKPKGIPCKKCGTYENVSPYDVKDEHGGGFKCIPHFCPPCLAEARGNNPGYTYTKLEEKSCKTCGYTFQLQHIHYQPCNDCKYTTKQLNPKIHTKDNWRSKDNKNPIGEPVKTRVTVPMGKDYTIDNKSD